MGGIPLSEWSGSGATRELHETIKSQIASMDKQSRVITRLTILMAILAIIQTYATIVQILPHIQGSNNVKANKKLNDSINTLSNQNISVVPNVLVGNAN